jgi:hypothetical protein
MQNSAIAMMQMRDIGAILSQRSHLRFARGDEPQRKMNRLHEH